MSALDELHVGAYADRLPSTLPYAVQKRVSLARALVSSPTLLLLDEPASGLSDEELASVGDLLRGLEQRMGVLLVEHHMDFVMSVCDRLVVLNFGTVVAVGTPDEVKQNPAVALAYLGEELERRAADSTPQDRDDVHG